MCEWVKSKGEREREREKNAWLRRKEIMFVGVWRKKIMYRWKAKEGDIESILCERERRWESRHRDEVGSKLLEEKKKKKLHVLA